MFCPLATNPSFIVLFCDIKVRPVNILFCMVLKLANRGCCRDTTEEGAPSVPFQSAPLFLLLQLWSACRAPSGVYLPLLSLTPQSSFSTLVDFLRSSVQFKQVTFPENLTSTTNNFPRNSIEFPGSLQATPVGNLPTSFSSTRTGSFLQYL